MNNLTWEIAHDGPNLASQAVHVWRSFLVPSEIKLDRLASTLSAKEIETARSFHFEHDRKRYILSHEILREILSRYLNLSPEEIGFLKDAFGKPTLTNNFLAVNFNISHAEDMALFAFTRHQPVGVDIERTHEINSLQDVAATFMSAAELEAFHELPVELQLKGFFRVWTRKEALIKALGKGMSMPLTRVEVGIDSKRSRTLTLEDHDDRSQVDWRIVDLDPSPNYVGAVVFSQPGDSLRLFTYSE
jgi:4'-phosphopantetheinyl transferase